MRTLNLGILAHVDAGKTTLTERLLFAAGVIDELGSVDDGSTQTDSLALERRRGITIKNAVVSFVVGGVTVNLIDTPGHPDFIAEVERVLNVLDGAVLVVSAVEGVQPQTRILMRTLQRLRIPAVLFANKIDRPGATYDELLIAIADRLDPSVVAMGTVHDLGTRAAGFVPFDDEDHVAHALTDARPVFFGSALTGAGVDELMRGVTEIVPTQEADPVGPVSGRVFKIDRGPSGEKVAYVRMFSGSVRVRDRIGTGGRAEDKATAIRVFERGSAVSRPSVRGGEIAKVWGLRSAKIGDDIGEPRAATEPHFDPPTLETVVVPVRSQDGGALHAALVQLTEQDPLIDLRRDRVGGELSVSLYGEIQKEVLQATLAEDYRIEVAFRESRTICIERPTGAGAAVETIGKENPFLATVGLRIEPAAAGSGVAFELDVPLETIPLYVYGSVDEFGTAMHRYVRGSLREGPHGWEVTDCRVTMTRSGYQSPGTGARDVRHVTSIVLMRALRDAGTTVCEPIHRFELEIPVDALGAVSRVLARLHADTREHAVHAGSCIVEGDIPAANVHELRVRLPGLTSGEGVLTSFFDHYRPVRGAVPRRTAMDPHRPRLT
jgi:ribosomal protection tetracycline resistance protein